MLNFKNLKIATKLILSTASLVIVAVATISISIGLIVQDTTEKNAQEIAKETAYRYANIVKDDFEAALVAGRTLAHLFETATNVESFTLTRTEANLMLKSFIEKNKQVFGIGVGFELNAFDGKDATFINAPGHDKTGRFIPYWTRNDQGEGVLEPLTDYEGENAAAWYRLPKQKKQECVIEPYNYQAQGKKIFMTTLAVPLLDNNNNFMGVVGIDIAFESLQRHLSEVKVSDFKRAYLSFYSAKGIVIAHENKTNLGKQIKDTAASKEFIDFILKNQAFLIERHSQLLETKVITYGAPVEIGRTGTRWIVTVNIPKNELTATATWVILLTIVIGISITILTIFTIYFLAQSLVKPLLQVNSHLKILAQGQLNEEDIDYQGTDEIAEIVMSFRQLKEGMKNAIEQANAIVAGDYTKEVKLRSNQDQLGRALADMIQTLREVTSKNAQQDWLKTGQTQLNDQISGEQDLIRLAENIINFLTPYLEAQVGVFYLLEEGPEARLKMIATHAYTWRKHLANEFNLGEGIVGQAALERKMMVITQPPNDYLYIQTGLGESPPQSILVMPLLYEDSLKGILELASFKTVTNKQIEFLKQVMPSIGIAVNTAQSRAKMQELLKRLKIG
jgi:methyl-accepting chemotaxis protein